MSNNDPMPLLEFQRFQPKSSVAQSQTPLFILHGLLGSMDNWRTQAKRLSQSRPVIIMDLRNHGRSPHIKGMSYREMYEDVLRVAQHENINCFHLLGHSMGGKVAMHLALAQPDVLKSLIVVDIAPKPYPLWHQNMLQAVMTAPVARAKSRKEIDTYLANAIEDRAERAFMLKNLKRNDDGGYAWRCDLDEISRGYLKIAGFTTALQQFTKKTLFIKGEQSSYIQATDAPLITSLFPNSQIKTIEQSGHLPHIQQSDTFFHWVDASLSSVD